MLQKNISATNTDGKLLARILEKKFFQKSIHLASCKKFKLLTSHLEKIFMMFVNIHYGVYQRVIWEKLFDYKIFEATTIIYATDYDIRY